MTVSSAVKQDQSLARRAGAWEKGRTMLPDAKDIILETRGLTKRYGGVHALEDVDCVIRHGEHIAIVGDNGAGKSAVRAEDITEIEPTAGKVLA